MTNGKDNPDTAPSASRIGRLPARAAQGLAKLLSRAARTLTQFLPRMPRRPPKGIFPPIGVISVLALAALSIGAPPQGAGFLPFYIFLGICIIIGALMLITSRERYQSIFASTFGWLPVLLGLASWPFWHWYADFESPTTPSMQFFEVAAQVLPLLLLATVIDVRRTKELKSNQLVLPIISIFLAELQALNAVAWAGHDATPTQFATVAAGLVTSIFALILAVMADITSYGENEANAARQSLPPPSTTSPDPKTDPEQSAHL